MYTIQNYRTKRALRDAIAAGTRVTVYQPGPTFERAERGDGTVYLEGPHYPQPHRWYAVGTLRDGALVAIR